MRNYTLIILFILLFFSGCAFKKKARHYLKKATGQYQKDAPPVTIWIHGTKQFFSKFFCKDFFYNPIGLCPALEVEDKYHIKKIANWLSAANKKQFPLREFYFFGWSGDLSFEARIEAAQELYTSLKQLRENYFDTYGCYPKIQIITHSHGGNVALHLPEVKNPKDSFSIDKLILLACPVQARTARFLENSLFNKVYSIFSSMDSIQVMDPQGFHYWRKHRNGSFKERIQSSFFSNRTFDDNHKLLQVKVKFDNEKVLRIRRGLMHIEFILKPFVTNLPLVLEKAENHYAKTGESKMLIKIKK